MAANDPGNGEDWGLSDDAPQPSYRNPPAYWGDKQFFRLLLRILGGVAIITVLGIFLLSAFDKDIPDSIVALGSTALGALAGLIARGNQ